MKEEFMPESLARKLLLKGCPLSKVYKDNGDSPLFYEKPIGDPGWSSCDAWFLPTIAQVLKWLREDKKFNVNMRLYAKDGWYFTVQDYKGEPLYSQLTDTDELYMSYEEAALAGIEYVLDNLIKDEKL